MYGPRCVFDHATARLCVCSAASVMSPDAPARTAKIGASGRRPLATTMRSPEKIGVGAVIFELRPSLHSSLPVSGSRSEEHTSELQSRLHLVCRLLLEKK